MSPKFQVAFSVVFLSAATAFASGDPDKPAYTYHVYQGNGPDLWGENPSASDIAPYRLRFKVERRRLEEIPVVGANGVNERIIAWVGTPKYHFKQSDFHCLDVGGTEVPGFELKWGHFWGLHYYPLGTTRFRHFARSIGTFQNGVFIGHNSPYHGGIRAANEFPEKTACN